MNYLADPDWRALAEWLGLWESYLPSDPAFEPSDWPAPPAQDSPATFLVVLKALDARGVSIHLHPKQCSLATHDENGDLEHWQMVHREARGTPNEALLRAALALMQAEERRK